MSVRRKCSHPTERTYVRPARKIHRMMQPETDCGALTGRTTCNIKGVLVTVHMPDGTQKMSIRSPADHNYPVTDVDSNVTCVRCIRSVLGIPMRKRKVAKLFRSQHLRRAVSPLGLLKG